MAEFSELIRRFDKIRDYIRDFYIYGFKSRMDFKQKSARTYDNEKRRIESYMGNYMKWDYTKKGKTSFISMDCSRIPVNPLYAAWKSKAFTANDIMLHFYILDTLKENESLSIEELTDQICMKSSHTFDVQTVRNKCKEYIKSGILNARKSGKSLLYSISPDTFESLAESAPGLIEAVKFYQGSELFGEIGSFILDNENLRNEVFVYKHNYITHTLEDGILLDVLQAIRMRQQIEFVNYSERNNKSNTFYGVPLKIFISTSTGRRYLCVYKLGVGRFFTYRLDHIKSVKCIGIYNEAEELIKKLDNNIDKVWAVGFGGRSRLEIVCMKLHINEQTEGYVLERINREGQGGELQRLEENIFLYTKELYDSNDISPWIKTFTGRIVQLEGTNEDVIGRFYLDISKMMKMYED